MKKDDLSLTPSNIRYLITIFLLMDEDRGVHSIDIANALGVKKASVHSMLNSLFEKGYLKKEKYGKVFLTESGKNKSKIFNDYFSTIKNYFQKSLNLDENDSSDLTFNLLSGMTEEKIKSFCSAIEKSK